MVTSIISTITETVTGLLEGIGVGIVKLFNDLFVTTEGALSNLGLWVIVLLGVSIALGAVAWVSTLIRGKQR